MKRINKAQQPTLLQQWRAANINTPQNLRYNEADFPRDAVLNALLIEQGNLCAYTLKRVSAATSHIEHIKPQNVCKTEDLEREAVGQVAAHEDVAWGNMVACCPQPNVPAPDYGAVVKDCWWDSNLFISPLAQNCEQRFMYLNDGSVKPAVNGDAAASETIHILNLNNPRLKELRHNAILRAGIHPKSQDAIRSAAQVKRLIRFWQGRSGNQSFSEFCVTLIHVAQQHLCWIQRQAQRRAHAQGK